MALSCVRDGSGILDLSSLRSIEKYALKKHWSKLESILRNLLNNKIIKEINMDSLFDQVSIEEKPSSRGRFFAISADNSVQQDKEKPTSLVNIQSVNQELNSINEIKTKNKALIFLQNKIKNSGN